MNFLVDYTTYMRSLAASHSSIHHTTDEKHFFRGELQEFFEQFRSDVCFPCLIAESSENDYEGTAQNIIKRRITSYIVADRYDQHDDYDEIQQKMSNCEQIAEEILGRLMTDDESPFVSVEIESVTGQYIQNTADRYVGYRISFTGLDNVCVYNNSVWQ